MGVRLRSPTRLLIALGGTDDEGLIKLRTPRCRRRRPLFLSRVDEQASRDVLGGALERAGIGVDLPGRRSLADRPLRAVALSLTDEGAEDRVLFGFDGALWGVAGDQPDHGFARSAT